MVILRQIPLDLHPGKIVTAMFQGRTARPDWLEKVQKAASQLLPVLQPSAVYDSYEVERVSDHSLLLSQKNSEDAYSITIGPNAVLMNRAEQLVAGLVTLGDEIDSRIGSMNEDGQILEAYIADCIGIYALLQVSRAVYYQVERLAEQQDWGVGCVMSPGAISGWPLEEQALLCSLLPIELINVGLNSSNVLNPQKSVSFVVGIGPTYSSKTVQLPCQVCINDGDCWCKY